MDLLPARRDLNRGFGNTFSKAFEFAGTLGLFLLVGWRLDRWLGVQPLFMIVLTVFALAGLTVKLWYAYDAEMSKHEEQLRRGPGP